MSETLISLILERLDQVESPVFRHREVEAFPLYEFEALTSEGMLRETSRATEIPRPPHLPAGGDLIVRQTTKGLYGVADEDDYFDPIPLEEDDVRQYAVSIRKLAAKLQRDNDIQGAITDNDQRLFTLGKRPLPDGHTADVYFSLMNDDESGVLSVCRKVCPSRPRLAVVLVPHLDHLSIESRQLLKTWNMTVLPLSSHINGPKWTLPWDSMFIPDEDEARAQSYCRVIGNDGTRYLSREEYETLISKKKDYDIFIDGFMREVSHSGHKNAVLTAREFSMIAECIEARKPLKPQSTKIGNNAGSIEAARKTFTEARKKVDIKVGRNKYTAFHLRKGLSPEVNAYEFSPPEGLRYCLVIPTQE